MGRVAAPLAVEIHGRIPRIVRGGRRRVLALETLEARPSVDQGAVDREMLVGEQPALLGLGADPLEKARAMSPRSSRSRFFVNTVASQIGSSMAKPTNHRKSRL